MLSYACAFICGIVIVHHASVLPSPMIVLIGLAGMCVARDSLTIRLMVVFLIGASYAAIHADTILRSRLPAELNGITLKLQGKVIDVSQSEVKPAQLLIEVRRAATLSGKPLNLQRVQIKHYQNETAKVGEDCQFFVRLKVPRGLANPGVRDKARWYFQQRINAVGYVVSHRTNLCLANEQPGFFAQLRSALGTAINNAIPIGASRGVIKALAFADRGEIKQAQWQVLRDTGTTHLLAISGLHISLIATASFLLARIVLSIIWPWSRRFGAQLPAAAIAFGCAFFYAGLAGFSLPTQRALIMVGIAMLAIVRARRVLSYNALLIAAVMVVIIDPLAPLAMGFWLSFFAVLLLVMTNNVCDPGPRWRKLLHRHTLLGFGLTPLLLLMGNGIPISSPLANFIAVPMTALIIVPLVFAGILAFVMDWSIYEQLWFFAATSWDLLWQYLIGLESILPAVPTVGEASAAAITLALVGVFAIVVPIFKTRWIFAALCTTGLFIKPINDLSKGEFDMIIFDVGQGLSVVVQTRDKTLLFDTGPQVGGYSAGEYVVAAALRALGVTHLDQVILSHFDNDHAGGYFGLQKKISINNTLISYPHERYRNAQICDRELTWMWNGVEFRLLEAGVAISAGENNRSCVLQINGLYASALLPGDIEAHAERKFVDAYGSELRADLLIAPHHGSATSSTPSFLDAVSPRHVVYATGYGNRFGFPAHAVSERVVARGISAFNTADSGAIYFAARASAVQIDSFARRSKRYWHISSP